METLVQFKNVLCQILIIGLLLKLFVVLFIPKPIRRTFWNTTKFLFRGGNFVVSKTFSGVKNVATKISLQRALRKEQLSESNQVEMVSLDDFNLAKEKGD